MISRSLYAARVASVICVLTLLGYGIFASFIPGPSETDGAASAPKEKSGTYDATGAENGEKSPQTSFDPTAAVVAFESSLPNHHMSKQEYRWMSEEVARQAQCGGCAITLPPPDVLRRMRCGLACEDNKLEAGAKP